MPRLVGRPLLALGSCAVLASAAVGFSAPESAHAATVSPDGLYHSAQPKRLLDTRSKGGSVGVNGTVTVPRSTLTAAGVPSSGVQSVVVNLTVTGTTGPGYIVAYGAGSAAPNTSTVNFPKGWTGAGTATVAITGSGLTVKVGGGKGTRTQIIVDIQGWYSSAAYTGAASGSGFARTSPFRFYDSRAKGEGPLKGGNPTDGYYYQTLELSGWSEPGWEGTTPTAILVNLTATGSTGPGNLAGWDGSEADWPSTSTVNFGKGENAANTAVIPMTSEGDDTYSFGIANLGRYQTNFIVDVLGYYYTGDLDSGTYKHVAVAPKRVMNFAPVGAGKTVTSMVPSSMWDIDRTGAFEGTLTAVTPSKTSYLTAWDAASPRPGVSTLNVAVNQTRSNGTLVNWFHGNPGVSVYNNAGTSKAIVDITGRFDWTGPISSAASASPVVKRASTINGTTRFVAH